MNAGTFGKRLQAVTGGLGALAFWSVHWILVGDGAWASLMWAGPSLGGGIWFQPHRAPALGPDCAPDSCPLAWLGGASSRGMRSLLNWCPPLLAVQAPVVICGCFYSGVDICLSRGRLALITGLRGNFGVFTRLAYRSVWECFSVPNSLLITFCDKMTFTHTKTGDSGSLYSASICLK